MDIEHHNLIVIVIGVWIGIGYQLKIVITGNEN
jgi:hypothetical protein